MRQFWIIVGLCLWAQPGGSAELSASFLDGAGSTARPALPGLPGLEAAWKVDWEDFLSGARLYTIRAGCHSSGLHLRLLRGDVLEFDATFDESARYETRDPANQADLNKLAGFNDCLSFHYSNSARFAWRWIPAAKGEGGTRDDGYGEDDGELEIHAYVYAGGVRRSARIGSVGLHEAHRYRLEAGSAEYVFRLDEHEVRLPRGCSGNPGLRYGLFPYFGGDERAPHDISILIDFLIR